MRRPIRFPYWLLIILLAAFAVGYLAWTESLRDENVEYGILNIGSLSTRHPSGDSLETTGEYAGWKTYRNEEYGFEVRYPASQYECNLTHFVEVCATGINSFDFGIYDLVYLPKGTDSSLPACGSDYKDCVEENKKLFSSFEQKVVPVYREGAVQLYGVHSDGARIIRTIIPVKNGVLIIQQNSFSEELDNIYNQILSTFKFIE